MCSIEQFTLNSNDFLCYPSCLSAPDGFRTRDVMPSCATVRNTALCTLKLSTNIAFNWACSGATATTDPCTNSWSHVYCQGEDVLMIIIENESISGTLPTAFFNLYSLERLDFRSNSMTGIISSCRKLLLIRNNTMQGPYPHPLKILAS